MLIGYARVSTDDQDLALQRAALKEAGCRRLYEEKVSGARRDRPQLARLLDQVREEDVVVVYRLDRLARSTRDLLGIAEQLRDTGAGLRSLAEPWADTTSPAGRMVLTVFAGIAEFERALIHERTSTGRAAAMRAACASAARPSSPPSRSPLPGACSRRGPPPARLRGCSTSIVPPSIELLALLRRCVPALCRRHLFEARVGQGPCPLPKSLRKTILRTPEAFSEGRALAPRSAASDEDGTHANAQTPL